MTRNKNLSFFIILLIILSCQNNPQEEYYSNGNLKSRFQVDENGLLHGNYKEFYEDGYSIKKKAKFNRGIISDTIFYYHENGKIKSKGLEKDGLPIGWWSYFDTKGYLTEINEIKIIEGKPVINQKIQYNSDGEINFSTSSFFELNISDTLSLGPNMATVNYHSDIKDYTNRYMYIIVENQYPDGLIKKDTFTDDIDKLWFGIYAHKKGNLKIEGVIEEKLVYYEETSIDSADLTIMSNYKYFEKKVYVKDTID